VQEKESAGAVEKRRSKDLASAFFPALFPAYEPWCAIRPIFVHKPDEVAESSLEI